LRRPGGRGHAPSAPCTAKHQLRIALERPACLVQREPLAVGVRVPLLAGREADRGDAVHSAGPSAVGREGPWPHGGRLAIPVPAPDRAGRCAHDRMVASEQEPGGDHGALAGDPRVGALPFAGHAHLDTEPLGQIGQARPDHLAHAREQRLLLSVGEDAPVEHHGHAVRDHVAALRQGLHAGRSHRGRSEYGIAGLVPTEIPAPLEHGREQCERVQRARRGARVPRETLDHDFQLGTPAMADGDVAVGGLPDDHRVRYHRA